MLRPIRYYCPPGVDRPAHRADLVGGVSLVAGAGPDVASGGPGGGMVIGGLYEPAEGGWSQTAAGWWLHMGDTVPQHLARAEGHPRIVRWTTVDGAQADHRWRVPVLVAPSETDDGTYVSTLERALGAAGWQAPADLAPIQARLLDQVHGLARGGDFAVELERVTDLVIELLTLGHHVSRHELIAAGWLTERVLLRVLIAAAAVPLPEAVA